MANRVVLTKDFVKISKPGVNVLTATFADLIFDSTAGEALSVLQTGTFTALSDSVYNQVTRIDYPDPGFVPLIGWQAVYGANMMGGGYTLGVAVRDAMGQLVSPAPTAEQQQRKGGFIKSSRAFFEYYNYAAVNHVVRYVIFNLPLS